MVLIIGLLATVGAILIGAREKAFLAVMKADLRNLVSVQEPYFIDKYTYANSVSDLPLIVSEGITMELLGEARGFTARTTHAGVPAIRCAITVGTVSTPYDPATSLGLVMCDGPGAGPGSPNGTGKGKGKGK